MKWAYSTRESSSNFFQLGLMGIEIPVSLGGSGSSFFMAILAIEELSRVDASAGVIVDVQNTLVNKRHPALGVRGAKESLPPPSSL